MRDALLSAGITVIAQASNAREARDLAIHYRPDVLLLDVGAERDGITAASVVTERAPEVRLLLISASEDPEMGMRALRSGAHGYLTKDLEPAELASSVQRIAAGQAVVSDLVLQRMIEYLRALPVDGRGMRPVYSPLTSREWEVLDVLAAGHSINEIAARFVLSPETVRSHLKSIMRKLEVHSPREAVLAVRRLRAPYDVEEDAGGPAAPTAPASPR